MTAERTLTATDEHAMDELRAEIAAHEGESAKHTKLVIFAWSGDLDRIWPTFILATTAAAMGMQTTVFFTFWGLFPLVKDDVDHGRQLDATHDVLHEPRWHRASRPVEDELRGHGAGDDRS